MIAGELFVGTLVVPTVKESKPPRAIDGAIHPTVAQAIRAKLPAVRECYETRLRYRPALAGALSVEFMVGTQGLVSVLGVSQTSMRDQQLESCVLRAFPDWVLPERNAEFALIEYSFTFGLTQ